MSGFLNLKIFLLIIIMSLTINIGAADLDSDFHGIPSYIIFTYTDNFVVNPGDNVSVAIYISGVGDVDANKLRIKIPPYIIDNETMVLESHNVTNFKNIAPYSNTYYNKSGIGWYLQKEYFTFDKTLSANKVLFNYGEEPHAEPHGEPGGNSPLTLNFKIKKNALPGDYAISTVLFYKNGSQWYNTERSITIHINHWYEEYQSVIIIVTVILALVSLIVSVIRGHKKKMHYISHTLKKEDG